MLPLQTGPRKMVQWLRPLAALTKDLGLVPSTHTMAQNQPWVQFQGIQYSPQASVSSCQACEAMTCMQANRCGNCSASLMMWLQTLINNRSHSKQLRMLLLLFLVESDALLDRATSKNTPIWENHVSSCLTLQLARVRGQEEGTELLCLKGFLPKTTTAT